MSRKIIPFVVAGILICLVMAVSGLLAFSGFVKAQKFGSDVTWTRPFSNAESMKVIDLAHAIAPGAKVDIIGIRPGEKLHEVMIPRDESINTLEYKDYYLIKPAFRFFERRFCEDGCKKVADDFEYNSGTNTWWLTIEEMKAMI